MEYKTFTGKTLEEALNNAKITYQEIEENIFYNIIENKKGLFSSNKITINAVSKSDIIDYLKKKIKELINNMNINVNIEVKKNDKSTILILYTDKDSLLIGKNGKTLLSIESIIRQNLNKCLKENNFHFSIDINDYKETKHKILENQVKKLAGEVQKTKIDVKLDSMNSYERRIIHNALTNFKNISTISEGEEPHRYVIIKYQE